MSVAGAPNICTGDCGFLNCSKPRSRKRLKLTTGTPLAGFLPTPSAGR
jgi:hypothetical protein